MTRKEPLTPHEEALLPMVKELTGRTKFNFEFQIGKDLWSEGLLDNMEKHRSFSDFSWECFARHCLCDWGDAPQEDKDANDEAFKTGGQLFSTYTHSVYPTVCVLTEADRSETVIGLLEEFQDVET